MPVQFNRLVVSQRLPSRATPTRSSGAMPSAFPLTIWVSEPGRLVQDSHPLCFDKMFQCLSEIGAGMTLWHAGVVFYQEGKKRQSFF